MKKTLIAAIILIAISLMVSCQKEDNESKQTVTLKNTESYTMNFLAWDWEEQRLNIKVQAEFYEISEVVQKESDGSEWEYNFKPEAGFVGKENVVIEMYRKSPDGVVKVVTYRMVFKIKN